MMGWVAHPRAAGHLITVNNSISQHSSCSPPYSHATGSLKPIIVRALAPLHRKTANVPLSLDRQRSVEVGGFVACFIAISLERRHLSKIATYFSSPCCARVVGTADEPAWSLQGENNWRQTDTQTDTQTHKPSTVSLAAHARRGLTSECKTLWGEPEQVRRISAVNLEDECTVQGCE